MISVIIPIYNSSKTIKSTVNSILKQTFTDFEVLLVDDGSTDDSAKVCNDLCRVDKRIRYFYQKNGGPGSARNFGMRIARGEFIAFCDADDLPETEWLYFLQLYLFLTNADIALCDIYSERDGSRFGFPWEDRTVLEGQDYFELISNMIGKEKDSDEQEPLWGSACRCLYKKEIIQNNRITFPTDIRFAEDLVFTLRYLAHANKAVICDKPLYLYVYSANSLMNGRRNYVPTQFTEIQTLIGYMNDIIEKYPNQNVLFKRFEVTKRCYYRECVGNACTPAETRSFKEKMTELNSILNNLDVKNTFRYFNAKNIKMFFSYLLIKKKMALAILTYYQFRLR